MQRAEVKLRLSNMMIERGRPFENSQIASAAKQNILNFGMKSIMRTDKAGISDVNLDKLLAYSRGKTAMETTRLVHMNENELRTIVFDKVSAILLDESQNSSRVVEQQNQDQNLLATNADRLESKDHIVKIERLDDDEQRRVTMAVSVATAATPINESQNIRLVQLKLPQTTEKPAVTTNIEQQSIRQGNQLMSPAIEKVTAPTSNIGKINIRVATFASERKRTITVYKKPPNVQVFQQQRNENLQLPPPPLKITLANTNIGQNIIPMVQQSNQNAELSTTSKVNVHGRYVHLNIYKFYPVDLIAMCNPSRLLNLSTDTEVKESLLAEGFPNWNHNDYKLFCKSVLKYGRFDVASVAEMMQHKEIEEVAKYHKVFFQRGPNEAKDIKEIYEHILLQEISNRKRSDVMNWKMLQLAKPESHSITQKPHAQFTFDHDRYLIYAISRYGQAFNVCDRVISDIRYV